MSGKIERIPLREVCKHGALRESAVILNSFILSWTRHPQIRWGESQADLEKKHVLFMTDDREGYLNKLFARLSKSHKK